MNYINTPHLPPAPWVSTSSRQTVAGQSINNWASGFSRFTWEKTNNIPTPMPHPSPCLEWYCSKGWPCDTHTHTSQAHHTHLLNTNAQNSYECSIMLPCCGQQVALHTSVWLPGGTPPLIFYHVTTCKPLQQWKKGRDGQEWFPPYPHHVNHEKNPPSNQTQLMNPCHSFHRCHPDA